MAKAWAMAGRPAQQASAVKSAAAANRIADIVLAFDEALGKVMKETVTWTVTNPALQTRPRRL